MVLVICEKTGIEFDAPSKQTKTHPKIRSKLTEASKNKRNWYREALQALEEGRNQQLDSIEDFLALLEEARKAKEEERGARFEEIYQEKIARRRAIGERERLNNFLKRNGYSWKYFEADEEDADLYGMQDEWVLMAPNGEATTLRAAMTELAHLPHAQEWLQNHPEEDK
jgi:hypothetical protein